MPYYLLYLPGLINWTTYITMCIAPMFIGPSWDQAPFMLVCTAVQQKPAPAVKFWQPEWRQQGKTGKTQSHTAGECLGQILGVSVPSPVAYPFDPVLSRGECLGRTLDKQTPLIKTSPIPLKQDQLNNFTGLHFPPACSPALPSLLMRERDLYLSQSCPSVRCREP